MRIVHIAESSVGVKGGKESHLHRFIAQSAALGHENAIVADTAANIRSSEDLLDVISNQRLPSPPDVILLHSTQSWRLAEDMSKIAPTYAWVHDYAFVCPASISWFRNTKEICDLPLGYYCITNAYTKWCNARRPDRNIKNYLSTRRSLSGVRYLQGIIVASTYMKKRLMVNEVPESLIHVLPYFIVDESHNDVDYTQEKSNRILFVGRLSEVKGVEVLLEALAILPTNYELVIAGDGYNKKNIEDRLHTLGLAEERVIFDGYIDSQDRLRELYQSATVVAVPSLWPEPFGIVGLEAFTYGKPVVAFSVGGIPEWLADGEVGLLAKPGDAHDLAAKLLQLLQDSEYRHTLGRRGKQHVAQSFSWEKHWKQFVEILERNTALA